MASLPENADFLVLKPSPAPGLARKSGKLMQLPLEELQALAGGFDCVVDMGELAKTGLRMDLGRCCWDVLGKVEDVLRAVERLLRLLRPGGRLLVPIAGDPADYLAGYLAAFPVRVQKLPGDPQVAWELFECVVELPIGPSHLDAVLAREVLDERSHRRYADALDAALVGERLAILDVGGGDGHMAQWWAESGQHEISLLEVDEAQAKAAELRLGKERVTLIDGVSPWALANKSFDVCLLLHVLHHIPSEDALRLTLTEAERVSRRQVLIMEDQPRAATSQGLCRLAAAVTAEHFRPFKQDPNIFMRNIRPDSTWRALFADAGLRLVDTKTLPGTLQHPVPHTLYDLRPHC